MPIGVGLRLTVDISGSTALSPAQLFAANNLGAWYDPSDLSTIFQDSAGTTAVTAVEQPVGLILDKSKGRSLGAELVTNNTFATDTSWTKGTGWSIGSGVATKTAGTASVLSQDETFTAGVTYRLVYTITRTAGSIQPRFTGGTTVNGTSRSAAGTYVEVLTAVSGNITLEFSADATFAGTVDNVYLKRVAGNDAWQITSTSRPVLSSRVNLLTYSEQFDNAVWTKGAATITANATTAPNGTVTADKLVEDTANAEHFAFQTASSVTSGATYTQTIFAKASGRNWLRIFLGANIGNGFAWVNLATGAVGTTSGSPTVSVTDVGSGWYRIAVSKAATGTGATSVSLLTGTADGTSLYTGDGTSGVYVWGADLRAASDGVGIPTYQRIAADTDYDTVGFPLYLRFDGTDDSLATSSIDFTSTDKVTVWAGVRKLSDAATGMLYELGNSSPNAFFLTAPQGATATYAWSSKGSLSSSVTTPASYASPISNIVTGLGDIANDGCVTRVNGTQVGSAAADQGTGNFGNLPLYIGRRGGTTLPFNGRLYNLVIWGAQANAAQISAIETWVNGRTKAY